MELKVDMPSLAGQDIDPETFQRVWNRVMPDQAVPRYRRPRGALHPAGGRLALPAGAPPRPRLPGPVGVPRVPAGPGVPRLP